MENIIVVECISTGMNYIGDILNRGYNPIVLEPKSADTEEGEEYRKTVYESYELIPYDFDIIYEKDTYEETLEMVKKLNPVLIVAGSEKGVILTTKLSSDLGLLGNPIENLPAMTLKDQMQKRLAENGLRYIRGKVVKSVEEAIDFYDGEKLNEVVIKPIYSAGSASVRICLNRQEMIDAIDELMTKSNYYGDQNKELLIQERIDGIEYIVNTVSCAGTHRVTLMWKYSKVKTDDGAIVYDYIETVDKLKIGEAELVEYAYKVADAIGIMYGPVHGEYMIDENGPVLIEVNCRPAGANMDADFLDSFSGQHETDSALDSYLKPKRFEEELKRKYRLYGYAALKMFIVPKDITAKSAPLHYISSKLETHYKTALAEIVDAAQFFYKTEDLHTSCGIVYLTHKSREKVLADIEFLRNLEDRAFSLVLSEGVVQNDSKSDETYIKELKPVIEFAGTYGTGLLITDQKLEIRDILQTDFKNLENIRGEFEFVIVNVNKSTIDLRDDIVVKYILEILSRVRPGGYVLIPKNTYNLVPGGRNGAEALVQTLELNIEVPPYGITGMIIASRN